MLCFIFTMAFQPIAHFLGAVFDSDMELCENLEEDGEEKEVDDELEDDDIFHYFNSSSVYSANRNNAFLLSARLHPCEHHFDIPVPPPEV